MSNDPIIAHMRNLQDSRQAPWECELLGGARDGFRFAVSKLDYPNFPPEYYEFIETERRDGELWVTRVQFRMKWLRHEDNVFVYERQAPK